MFSPPFYYIINIFNDTLICRIIILSTSSNSLILQRLYKSLCSVRQLVASARKYLRHPSAHNCLTSYRTLPICPCPTFLPSKTMPNSPQNFWQQNNIENDALMILPMTHHLAKIPCKLLVTEKDAPYQSDLY